jgi:integrase
LSKYAFPVFGDKRVDLVDTADVLRALTSIWLTKPETARRVKQRIGAVLDWAKAAGFRAGDNPVQGVTKGLPRQTDRPVHFKAMAYEDLPSFLQQLQSSTSNEIARLAFEFMILTAARTSEVLHARWDEVNLVQAAWTVPAPRMKARREHRVPLTARCIEILERARLLSSGSDLVFPGRSINQPMSNMVFLMTLRRMEIKVTAHGFRSAFRDWAAERTNFPRDVCEMALAHTIKSKAEAAYRRGDLLEKRRELMTAWEAYATM